MEEVRSQASAIVPRITGPTKYPCWLARANWLEMVCDCAYYLSEFIWCKYSQDKYDTYNYFKRAHPN